MILNNASDVRRGTNLTEYVYRGSTLVWQRKHPHPDPYVPVPGERHYGIKFKGGYNGLYTYEYLYDAANKSPATVDSYGNVSLGGWATAFFIVNNYPCMLSFSGDEDYKLNPADVRYKINGDSSDYNNIDYNGNAMSCFNSHIWMKFYEDNEWFYIEVADSKLDDDFVDYPYIRSDGTHADRMYFPLYGGSLDSQSRLRSIGAGRVKEAQLSTTFNDLISAAERNGIGWQIKSYAFMLWIEALMILMFRGYNELRSTGYAAYDTYQNGWSYNRGQFCYLKNSNGRSTVHNTFFCEWLWGGRAGAQKSFDMMTGIYYLCHPDSSYWNPNICYKMFPPYTSDGSLNGYEEMPVPMQDHKITFSKNYGMLPDEEGTYAKLYVAPFDYGYFSDFRTPFPYFADNSNHCELNFYPNLKPYRYLTSSVFYV